MFKVMDAVTVAFQNLDLVVESFAGSVGSAILPAVLDVGAVVPDGVGAPPGALMVGGGISVKPVSEHSPLYRISRLLQDAMEPGEGVIGFPEVIGKGKCLFQQRSFELEGVLPVLLLMGDGGGEEPGGTFQDLVGSFRAIRAERLLKGAADFTDIVIEKPDDMEQIDAYGDVRETPPGEGDKAAVHVTAEKMDASALLQGVIPEIVEQVFEIHGWKDIDDAAEGAVGEIAVETVDIPAPGILVINPGRALKLVNAECLRKKGRLWEVNGKEDRKHLSLRETVVEGDIPEGPCGHEGGADRKPGGNREL